MCVNCTQTGTGEKNPIFDILYKILKVVVYVFKFQNISFILTFFERRQEKKRIRWRITPDRTNGKNDENTR